MAALLLRMALVVFTVLGSCAAQRKIARTQPVTAEVKTGVNFDCPEEFGYYPHPSDCTQYYVCVFGGALLESCTGGLMYSHELQTCDWPRNVGCDASDGGAVAVATATAAPSTREPQQRTRYTPPPPPPQPAAIVTNRGQPRQLHHQHQQQQHQEIIKQQQLYEDAEETLPPAEEVESDRQQRVYRGQPSSIGQVQRDRDGLRNSNSIPTYSGRSEKIGIISFGTGQTSQPQQQQQYRLVVDVTNHLRRRRKRQIVQRAPAASSWHAAAKPSIAYTPNRPSHHSGPVLVHTPHGAIHKFHFNFPQTPKTTEEFRPFVPQYTNHKRPYNPYPGNFGSPFGPPKAFPLSTSFSHFHPSPELRQTEAITAPYAKNLTQAREIKPAFLSPPAAANRLNLEEILEKIREHQKAKINQTLITHYTTARPLQAVNLEEDDYYDDEYYDDDEEEEEDDVYSSQKKPFNTSAIPVQRSNHSALRDDEEYYYEEYDYPEGERVSPTPKPKWETKYSARYNEKLKNLSTTTVPPTIYVKTTKIPRIPSSSATATTTTTTTMSLKKYITKPPVMDAATPLVFMQVMSTTTKPTTMATKQIYTVRPRGRSTTTPKTMTTTKPPTTTTTTKATSSKPRVRVKTRHRQTTNKRINDHDTRLVDNRVEMTSAGPPQQPSSAATAAATRALYNGSHHYDPQQFDPYYNLYEDDVELYRDVDYSHQQQQQPQQQYNGYRGTPTPAIQQTSTTDEPKRGQAFVQTYNNQDLYQQSQVDYNEDNRFNSQVDDQGYRQPSRQQITREDEENPTQRPVVVATSPRPVTPPLMSSTTPLIRSPVTSSNANQTRAQSLPPNTLPVQPAHTPPSSLPSPPPPASTTHAAPLPSVATDARSTTDDDDADGVNALPVASALIDRRLDNKQPVTYRPKYHPDTLTEYSAHAPVRSAAANHPAPFTHAAPSSAQSSPEPIMYYLTKAYKSAAFSNLDDYPTRPADYLKRKIYYIRSTEAPSPVIQPTTYAPPKFFLKSLLPSANSVNQSGEYVIKSNGIKTIRKFISPLAINNIFASSTEFGPSSEELDSFERNFTTFASRGRIRFPSFRYTPSSSEEQSNDVTTYRYVNLQIPTTTSTSTTTTTTTTTTPSPPPPPPTHYQSTETYRHYVEPQIYHPPPPTKLFRNTVEVPPLHQLIPVDPDDLPKAEPDQPPTYKPRPPPVDEYTFPTKTSRPDPPIVRYPIAATPSTTTATTTTVTTANAIASAAAANPARASRVNAAIKSMIGVGGARRQSNSKVSCSPENQTTSAKCGADGKQRTQSQQTQPSRTRGSSHYTATNAVTSNNPEPINRGTPQPRSRPTLKPSTSIVSKATEFIDIYRFPPRRPDSIYPQPQPDKTAAKCRKDVCLLPDCSCGGKEIPGDVPVEQVPQIVLLTFDDSVNDLNKGLYSDLFEKGRVNPNGCPIAATFYVSHEWTDYSQVQNLYSDGHEMASHTVSHSFGEQFSQKKWTREVAGQREILSAYGGVKLEDVRGMRAPFLSVGGNKMFKMLYDANFTYDSSMPIYENKPPSWPYTLDYKLFHDCMIPPCPTRSYPGVWEVPMVMWQDLNGGRCSMGDACSNPGDSENVYKMLMKNFDRHYTTNRAPFGLFYHAAWFTQPHHKEGFINFLDTINQMKDVFLVTNWQAIQWVRDPTPMSRINSFQPFQCNYSDRPKRCNNPKVCNLWHKSGVRYMRTCQPCPDIYPWTGNTGIRSSRIDNDIED